MTIFRYIAQREPLKIFLIALVLRFAAVAIYGEIKNPQLWEYGAIARNIVSGTGYSLSYTKPDSVPNVIHKTTFIVPSAYMPPVYVLFITGFLELFGEKPYVFMMILALQALVGAMNVLLLYYLLLRIFESRIAKIAGFISALFPPFIYITIDYGPTVLYSLLLGLLWLLIWRPQMDTNKLRYIIAGLVAVLAVLTRGEAIFIVISLSIWIFFRSGLVKSLIFTCVFVVGISPWIVRNTMVLEGFVPITTSSNVNFWRGHNDEATGTGRKLSGEGIWGNDEIDRELINLQPTPRYEIERNNIYFNHAMNFIKNNPFKEFSLSIRKLIYLWTIDITHPKTANIVYVLSWGLFLFFFIIGIVTAQQLHSDISILILFYVITSCLTMAFFVLPRYQIILAYGMVPLSAVGYARIIPLRKEIFTRRINQ
jgi:4-amino-4-deoxy-L-arabinose transferase-like glycosyltransferase